MKPLIIDVREPGEYRRGHVKSAVNIPLLQLINNPKILGDIPKDTTIIIYCRTGNRSNIALQVLYNEGYTDLINGVNKQQIEEVGY